MSAFINQWKAELRSKVPVVLWLLVSGVLVVSGPFGSYGSFNLPLRLVFWLSVIGIGVLISSGIRTYFTYHPRQFSQRAVLVLATAVVCLVVSPPLYLLTTTVFDNLGSGVSRFFEIAALVAVVSAGGTALRQAVAPEARIAAPPADPADQEAMLMRRLEPCQRGALLAISVRDHYVDIHTSNGTGSLLMRFGDAVAEAVPVEGAQVHRSHWVAWAAVVGVDVEGAKVFLQLSHGARVPVSKNHRDKLQARGLI